MWMVTNALNIESLQSVGSATTFELRKTNFGEMLKLRSVEYNIRCHFQQHFTSSLFIQKCYGAGGGGGELKSWL